MGQGVGGGWLGGVMCGNRVYGNSLYFPLFRCKFKTSLLKKVLLFKNYEHTRTYKTFLEFFLENLICGHLINYVAQSGITAFKTQGYSLQL